MLRTLLICTAVAITGCATTTADKPSRPVTAANTGDPLCVTPATRIPQPNDCSAPGRSYSQQDIQRTGQTNVGEALQLLDPAVTVHR